MAIDQIRQINEIMILQGEFTERVYTIENSVKFSDPQQLILHVGDKVMLSAELTEDGSEIKAIHIYDYYRIDSLIIFIIITAVILLGIAWLKGLRTIITIGVTACRFIILFCTAHVEWTFRRIIDDSIVLYCRSNQYYVGCRV